MIINTKQKNKRILWLINHTTLREFEVPLLLSLGYEIYTPKCIPLFISEWSGSIEYAFDKTLTIPKQTLETLNQHDFYEDPITQPVATILNHYFSVAFCIFYPNLLEQITKHFHGKVLLRAFGLDKQNSYTKVMIEHLGTAFLNHLRSMGNRFWFSQCYPHIDQIESPILRSRSITHPLGLSKQLLQNKNSWVGGENKILFFCPRINISSTYYGKIYKAFKKKFGSLPHLIAGNQPVPVDDTCVSGYQPRSKIEQWLRTHAVMFYHSQEPRHLHYHPLEAIVFGMPLIYMKGGILEKLGGTHQPGMCFNEKEAKEKIKRILSGDEKLIQAIRSQQHTLLETFSLDYNRNQWEKNFKEKIMLTPPATPSITHFPIKTIGVFLPEKYRGGSLTAAKNIAKMIALGSHHHQHPIKVIFSCVAGYYNLRIDFKDLKELDISVRETTWEIIPRKKIELAQVFSNHREKLYYDTYSLPRDGINNFHDCDFWLFISDRLTKPLAPIKPYGMVIFDYIQRYVPEIFPADFDDTSFLLTARQAKFVLTTTTSTREDAIQYAGVHPQHVHLIPMEYSPPIDDEYTSESISNHHPYFIWTSNATPHKNHLRAIEALNIYYSDLNGQLDVIMTGTRTHLFAQEQLNSSEVPCVAQVRQLLSTYPQVAQHLKILGNINSTDYISYLRSAKFLWHPATIDNGTYSVIEAAYYSIPSLSSNYPQMHFMNERFHLNLTFFDATEPDKMAIALKKMERDYSSQRQYLPKKSFLKQFRYDVLAPEFWQILRELL